MRGSTPSSSAPTIPTAAASLLVARGIPVGGRDGREASVFGTRFLIESREQRDSER